MHSGPTNNRTEKIAAAIVVLLMTVLVAVNARSLSPKRSPAGHETSSTPDHTNSASSTTNSRSYKNGMYTAEGGYQSPGGTESITVSLTIKNDAVIDATVAPNIATDNDAQEFQSEFIDGYKTLVVGKNINDIHLSRVSGSSLTSNGFNNALEQIKSQAKA